MTRQSIHEYAQALRPRYLAATKAEKGRILDEFCRTTGYRRKSAVRLLRQPPGRAKKRRGRPQQYGTAVLQPLKTIWEVSNRLCSKRLAPFLPELLEVLERQCEMTLTCELRDRLLRLSPATIDRLLRPFRRQLGGRQPWSSGRSSALGALVPIRTFSDWAHVVPGSLQADLVLHCGESTEGFYLTTLMAVDVATGWTECQPVWGKGQQRVSTAVHMVRGRLPFALRELHTDNGSEFLNNLLYPWCREQGIRFSRGRPYKKNDQAYVEQKNWSVVRKQVGYDRYSSKAAYEQLAKLYQPLRLYMNFFQPIRKLIGKERVGAKVTKRYDTAKTPYQRLLESGVLNEAQRGSLEQLYLNLNPVQLRLQLDQALETLWKLAERTQPHRLQPVKHHAG